MVSVPLSTILEDCVFHPDPSGVQDCKRVVNCGNSKRYAILTGGEECHDKGFRHQYHHRSF